MSTFSVNPFMYIFSVVLIAAVVLYFSYLAVDRLNLETQHAVGIVLEKQHYDASSAPVVNIVAGRPWVQSQVTPEVFLLRLKLEEMELNAAVMRSTYELLKSGDIVRIKYQRRRLSGMTQVTEVTQ